MITRLRDSFAAKLLAAGLLLAILVIGSVSSYLLISRDRQTRAGALSNSDNRAVVMREVLRQFTGVQSASAATGLADQPALAEALNRPDPAAATRALFAATPGVDVGGEILVVDDAGGRPVYLRPAADLGAGRAFTDLSPPSLTAARTMSGTPCDIILPSGGRVPGSCGVELLGGRQPSYDVAVPVVVGRRVVGVVAYLAPLAVQLERFRALFQFPTAFLSAGDSPVEVRNGAGRDVAAPVPSSLERPASGGDDLIHGTYAAPTGSGGAEDVAGSFVAVRGIDHRHIVGYIGVEAPLAIFVGDTRTDELTLIEITLLVLFVTSIAIALFVNRFVKHPVGLLAGGVARIAGGDYGTPIDLRSRDELGRLAGDVNRMRDNIAAYLGEIQTGRVRLDSALARMRSVSRTLTMTTAGLGNLEREVVRTARAIAGDRATAVLASREPAGLLTRAADPAGAREELGAEATAEVLAGRMWRGRRDGGEHRIVIPMFYQDGIIGALAVIVPEGAPVPGADEEAVLTVLANNAAVAMENTRLLEQERETVRRLRELDAMKTDFLSTVQHELRTPLTAILGLADLLEMTWTTWGDEPKLEAVRDIQVAARSLHEMVETIINFALLEDGAMRLDIGPVPVRPAVDAATASIAARMRGGIPLAIEVRGGEELAILADPRRFEEVMRALLDNAIKFSPDGGAVQVVVGAEDGSVRIDVIDQGIGIPPGEIDRIFERFYQVDSTVTRRSGGTGMGLALVRRLVEDHHAAISVESRPGGGSRFTLRWPRAAVGAAV